TRGVRRFRAADVSSTSVTGKQQEGTATHNDLYYVGPREKEQFIAYLHQRLPHQGLAPVVAYAGGNLLLPAGPQRPAPDPGDQPAEVTCELKKLIHQVRRIGLEFGYTGR